jgi:ATP-binding cassette subfamily F protein uup
LLVSHDREFLNNVVTSTLVLEGEGLVAEYVGGYDDWLRQRKPPATTKPTAKKRVDNKPVARPKKLSYKEQQELEQLPQKIESLDRELAQLQQKMADPAIYRQEGAEIAVLKSRLVELEEELEQCYTRWEALDSIPR